MRISNKGLGVTVEQALRKRIRLIVIASLAIMLPVLSLGLTGMESSGASIVHVVYVKDGKQIASAVYTGPDGGSNSDPSNYWSLIGGPPEIVAKGGRVDPDEEGGKRAALKGRIQISVTIRNSINMGIVELDSLQLIRDSAKKQGWYLPKAEFKRIQAMVDKRLKPTMMVRFVKGYETIAQMAYVVPKGANEGQPSTYWRQLEKVPSLVDRSTLKPDEPRGKQTTLQGDLKIDLTPRPYVKLGGNSRFPGVVKLKSLKLVRDNSSADAWRLSNDELVKILKLVGS